MINMFELSYNTKSRIGEFKCDVQLLGRMPFPGVRLFEPMIFHDALFFYENANGIKWWHGWLKGMPFVSGFVQGIQCNFIYSRSTILINVENDKIVARYWGKSKIEFHTLSIDIGGEELVII